MTCLPDNLPTDTSRLQGPRSRRSNRLHVPRSAAQRSSTKRRSKGVRLACSHRDSLGTRATHRASIANTPCDACVSAQVRLDFAATCAKQRSPPSRLAAPPSCRCLCVPTPILCAFAHCPNLTPHSGVRPCCAQVRRSPSTEGRLRIKNKDMHECELERRCGYTQESTLIRLHRHRPTTMVAVHLRHLTYRKTARHDPTQTSPLPPDPHRLAAPRIDSPDHPQTDRRPTDSVIPPLLQTHHLDPPLMAKLATPTHHTSGPACKRKHHPAIRPTNDKRDTWRVANRTAFTTKIRQTISPTRPTRPPCPPRTLLSDRLPTNAPFASATRSNSQRVLAVMLLPNFSSSARILVDSHCVCTATLRKPRRRLKQRNTSRRSTQHVVADGGFTSYALRPYLRSAATSSKDMFSHLRSLGTGKCARVGNAVLPARATREDEPGNERLAKREHVKRGRERNVLPVELLGGRGPTGRRHGATCPCGADVVSVSSDRHRHRAGHNCISESIRPRTHVIDLDEGPLARALGQGLWRAEVLCGRSSAGSRELYANGRHSRLATSGAEPAGEGPSAEHPGRELGTGTGDMRRLPETPVDDSSASPRSRCNSRCFIQRVGMDARLAPSVA